MTGQAWLLVSWILVGAAFGLVHLVTLWQGLRSSALTPGWRVLALLPPATPVVAWLGGRRVAPGLWGAILLLYLALRLLG